MNAFRGMLANSLIMIVVVCVSGCATKGLSVDENLTTVDVSGFERDDSASPTVIFRRRPGAPELDKFDRFIIDPVEIRYDDPTMTELSLEQVSSMQQYLHNALVRELNDGGYEVGTRSDAGKLRISFTLSGLRAPSALPNVTSAVVPIAVSVGEATIEAVFRNALTNEVESVAVTRARGSRWLNPSPWSTWADVEEFFDGWAKGFRMEVDKAHGR